ncbi:MAG: hypothetical protein HYZ29_23395 [Myxococcales bacterium]|nr:hypothetical protein [Myxococcales bacterium]
MAFYDAPRSWYFHDLWKRTLSTWGGGQSWTRVDLSRPGPTLDYPDFAKAETDGNIVTLAAHGQTGIARRFRWNGSAWVLEAQRSTGDTGALPEGTAAASDGWVLVPALVAALIFWDVVR